MSGEPVRVERVNGIKGYGSIPHLPGSRRGPADRGLSDGQAAILTERTRDRHDCVMVQEKLDGSNVGAVMLVSGEIIAINRPGFPAASSPFAQHHAWARWVAENEHRFRAVLRPGERIAGEWMIQAHGTRYELQHEPFVAFDILTEHKRAPYLSVLERCRMVGFTVPKVLHAGPGALSVADALAALGEYGHHGALDPAEGCVWRVERRGVPDFLGKYVIPGKVDGRYLESVTGEGPVMNTFREAPRA